MTEFSSDVELETPNDKSPGTIRHVKNSNLAAPESASNVKQQQKPSPASYLDGRNDSGQSQSLTSKSSGSSTRGGNDWDTDSGKNAVDPAHNGKESKRTVMNHSASASAFDHTTAVDYSAGIGVSHSPSFSSLQQQRRKKAPWYNALYPSYKSRSDDFKRLFATLPDGERLIVEYSCALQKDILVHGRLYVSKNYLCFHANIFRWETCVRRRWKDIKNIVKEKTALVFPNAIEATTVDDERYFFTSFLARDRSYLMLFRLWQNALLDQPASSADIWKWIHSEYGDELGLTSEDENDYFGPFPVHRKAGKCSAEVAALPCEKPPNSRLPVVLVEGATVGDNDDGGSSARMDIEDSVGFEENDSDFSSELVMGARQEEPLSSSCDGGNKPEDQTKRGEDLTDEPSSEDDGEGDEPNGASRRVRRRKAVESGDQRVAAALEAWRCDQQGRELLSRVFPITVDQLFSELFLQSKFFEDFHTERKTFDIVQGPWEALESGVKVRDVSFTISLTHPMGPKHSTTTETQTMREESKPGQIYCIDVEVRNGGIPYADSFYVAIHACLSKCTPKNDPDHIAKAKDCSRLTIIAEIKYKKTVWGLVKTFIDKNTWAGLEDFYTSLSGALREHCEDQISASKSSSSGRKGKGGRRLRADVGTGVDKDVKAANAKQIDGDQRYSSSKAASGGTSQTYSSNASAVAGLARPFALSDILIKLIVFLLIALVLTNAALFYRLWNLEGRVADRHRSQANEPLPFDIDELLKFDFNNPNLDNLPDPSVAKWLKLLHRQEVAHQMELEKWHSLLGSATELLRQTEQSLTGLQRSIHPLALKKMRGLMFLQQEEWAKMLEDRIESSVVDAKKSSDAEKPDKQRPDANAENPAAENLEANNVKNDL